MVYVKYIEKKLKMQKNSVSIDKLTKTTNISIKSGKIYDGIKIKKMGSDGKKTFCSKTVEDNFIALKDILGK